MGGVADLAGHAIDEQGQVCQTDISNKVINYKIDEIVNAQYRLGVAVGNDKIAPVKAVLKGGYLNILIIDEAIAKELI